MSKRPSEHMKPNSRTCPHCGGDTVNYSPTFGRPPEKRCPKCRCRWGADGKHVIAGRRCPLQLALPLSA